MLGAASGIVVGATLLGHAPAGFAAGEVTIRLLAAGALMASLLLVIWPLRALTGERDRLEATVARSERLFERLWEESPSGTLYFDALGRPTFANAQWAILTGDANVVSSEQRWLDAITPADRSAVCSLWARARATLEPCRGEIGYLTHGEAGGYAEIAFYPEVEAGRVLGFAARLTDTTARRLDKVAQEEREARYRLLSEHAQDVILRLALDGCARYVSGAALRVIGYAPVEVVGRPLADFVHRDDLPIVERSLARLAAGRPHPSIEFRLRHRDGHYGWFESSQRAVFDHHGDPFEVVASLRDIGRRRRAEAAAANAAVTRDESLRLLALVEEAAGMGHWRLDRATRTLATSSRVHGLLGHGTDERLRPLAMLRSVHPDDRRGLIACLARARRAAGSAECAIHVTARGALRPVRLIAQADYRDAAFAGWSGVIEDIGEQSSAGHATGARGTADAAESAQIAPFVTIAGPSAAPPPQRGASSRALGASVAAATQSKGNDAKRELKVLVAKDDAAHRTKIAAIVGRMGHAVTTVESGRQAVAAATWHAYDVILLDLQMSAMDALAVTRAIRASDGPCAETIIIALTDDASPEGRHLYDGAGFSHVLVKPVEHALAARLDALAARPARQAREPGATAPAAPLIEAERISELRKVLGNERLDALMGLLIAECLDRPGHIRKAFRRGELAAIRAEGHGLKGAALSIGATALGLVAEQLEAVASVALAEPLIAALEECADSTRNAVLSLLAAPTDDRASA